MFPKGVKCKKCGKEIFPKPDWVYKRHSKKADHFYCSWKCYRSCGTPKRKIDLPNVGDTIIILRIPFEPSYTGRKGVVESIDFLGQLHGTWGKLQIIPGEDIYMIVKEGTDEQPII